jgi:Zn-dependent protease/CBS domain-containing protein
MFFKKVTLFKFFGFDVKADASWLFLGVLISWTMTAKVFPQMLPNYSENIYQAMGIAALAGIIVSIIMHEVAHAVIAEYYHMPIESITLFIFGGVAEMKGEPSHPRGEFFMAVAGPIMSGFLGLFFIALGKLYAGYIEQGSTATVLAYLGRINLLIAAFNMIPAFPLDGGRALRAIIWRYKNNLVLATRIASESGHMFAYLLMAYGSYQIAVYDNTVAGIWSGLLGLFMHSSGTYAVQQMEYRSLLAVETVARFMNTQVITVSPDLAITALVDNYIYKHYQRSFPVVDGGILLGVVSLQAVLSLDRKKWHWLHVASVMEPVSALNTVAPDFNAADALDLMQKHGKDSLLVAEHKKFAGIIAFRDLSHYLTITMRIDHNKSVESSRTAY